MIENLRGLDEADNESYFTSAPSTVDAWKRE